MAFDEGLAAGGLQRLEFLTVSSEQSSAERQRAVQDTLTRRRRR